MVGYDSANFMDKNRDQLSMDIVKALKASSKPFVSKLFGKFDQDKDEKERRGSMRKKKISTVSSEFRDQLQYLMGEVYYFRKKSKTYNIN
jgi:myosin heavy subunit